MKDFGRYSDPLSDPRGTRTSAISSMGRTEATRAASEQRSRTAAESRDAEKGSAFSMRRMLWLAALLIVIGPIVFFIFPLAGLVFYVVIFVAIVIDTLRRL